MTHSEYTEALVCHCFLVSGMNSRAYTLLTVKSVNEEKRILTGMASTPEADRVGDIVEPMGAQFSDTVPLLWMHQRDMPVGTVKFGKPTKEGIPFEAKIPFIAEPSQLKARIEEAWQSVKAGLVRAVSIGFRALEHSVIEETGGWRFTKIDILELSLVTVPACPGATIESIKSYDAEILAAVGKEGIEAPKVSSSGVTEKVKTVKLTPKEGKETMNILEQIKAFQAERAAKVAAMEEIMTKSAETGESLNTETSEKYDTLDVEVKEIDKHLARLETLQKAQAVKATTVVATDEKTAAATRTGSTIQVRKVEEKGIAFARLAKCLGMARGSYFEAGMIADKLYKDDPRIGNILKTAVAAGHSSDTTWAGNLIGDETSVYADFVEYLRPQTILGKFGTNGIPSLRRVPFRVALVGQTSGGTGYWIGEGKAKKLTKFDFSRTTLEPLKVANIAVITEEVLRDSSPSAEAIVRDQLAAALKERLDTDFIDPTKTASAGISPASITNGVVAVTSTGNTADDIRADLRALFSQFIAANNAPTAGVFIMSSVTALSLSLMVNTLGQPEFPNMTMNGGTLNGLPVIASEYVPEVSEGSYVILVNASDVYIGDEGGIRVDMSREASLEMDDAPTMDSDTPTESAVVSMFQTNSVAFRAERTINWAKRRASAVAVLDGVNWGASV